MVVADGKKAEALTAIVIIIIIVLFLAWLVNISARECNSNSDCGSGYYCGSDFACHKIPTIERTEVQNNLVLPSIIIGIAIVVAALILRWGRNGRKPVVRQETTEKQKSPFRTP